MQNCKLVTPVVIILHTMLFVIVVACCLEFCDKRHSFQVKTFIFAHFFLPVTERAAMVKTEASPSEYIFSASLSARSFLIQKKEKKRVAAFCSDLLRAFKKWEKRL